MSGARLAHEVESYSDKRAAPAVDPPPFSNQEQLRLKAVDITFQINRISPQVKDDVLAELLASESVQVRKQALRLSGRVRGR